MALQRSKLEKRQAEDAHNRSIFKAFSSILHSNGSLASIGKVANEYANESKLIDEKAHLARSRIYALEGKICKMRSTVAFCARTTNDISSYLGRGWLSTKRIVSSNCPTPCSGHQGFCDMENGRKYATAEQADRDNCRSGTDEELRTLLKIE